MTPHRASNGGGPTPFTWFSDQDNAILSADYCSLCAKEISDDEMPLLIFRQRGPNTDIRFHFSPCAERLFADGTLKLIP
jgi:hypothetical protein